MKKYFDTVANSRGYPLPNASVSVLNFGTSTLSSIFSDAAGASSQSNPLTTNSRGYFEFYAADGRYSLSISGADFTTVSITDILLDDPNDESTAVISGGSINSTTVGATNPAAGTFTTLTSTGNATLGDAEASDTHAIKGATTLLANSASAALTVTQTGSGNAFVVEDVASPDSTPFVIDSAGNVGIGGTPSAGQNVLLAKNMTGSVTAHGIRSSGQLIQSDVTSEARTFASLVGTATAAFALGNLVHYYAGQGTFGVGSTVSSQYGFSALSSIAGATNNYGHYSDIAAAPNRWNFYAAGTAGNAYAGNSSFGKLSSPTSAVDTTSLATGMVANSAATYTVLTTDHTIVQNTTASTYTLPAAASFVGRRLHLLTHFAGVVISASSNVISITGGATGTAILPAAAGKFAILQSDGTQWLIVAAN